MGRLSKVVEATKETEQKELQETVAHLRAELAEKKGIIKKFQESRGGQIELAQRVTEAIRALPAVKVAPYKPKDKSKSEVAFVADCSDLHVGELIRPQETSGFGAYTYPIAEKRMKVHTDNLTDFALTQRNSYNIPDLTIFGIGDYISGDIHQELLVSNEFPLPVQTAKAAHLIAQSVRRLAPHFRQITFHGVGADNHGRLQKKPQAKQKAANNMSFLVHALVGAYLKDQPNFKLIDYENMAPLIEVANHRFIVTHGDTIKSVMSIPWYGLERYIGKEAIRRMGSQGSQDFHYVNCAHFHTPLFLPRLLMNGSLSGTTEFDHACGRFGPPSQISYLVHRKYGVFNFVPWKFEVEKEI